MTIASLTHAALSAAAVGILLWMLRRAGPRAAGLAAAVPVNSLPALFWLSQEHGGAFAAAAVLGSLCGTGLTVLVGSGAVRIATARRAAATRSFAVAAPARTTPFRSEAVLLSMSTAAAMSLLVSALARHAGAQLCGLVAAIPVIGLIAAWAGWRQGGTARMRQVVAGYLDGMTAKAAFLAVLGAAWTLGGGAWAWPLGFGAAALALRSRRPRSRPRPRPAGSTPPPRLDAACIELGSLR